MSTTAETAQVRNHIGGQWVAPAGGPVLEVHDPGLGEVIAHTPVAGADEVELAVAAAREAFASWRRVAPVERIQPFFRLKMLMERDELQLARLVTRENGKVLADARGEVRRAIQNIEAACAITTLQMGCSLEDGAAAGIDEEVIHTPLGVFAAICPFNFPLMVPFWFWPYAVATGNTFIIKPSERVPLSMQRVFELVAEAGFPPGVVNMVNGDRTTAAELIAHPAIQGISFVGSTPAAQLIYRAAADHGKRVQAQGGAKNAMVFMPDADWGRAVPASTGSCFGAAGQRCLAGSLIIAVGDACGPVVERLAAQARYLRVGYGLEIGVDMGPVISAQARERIARAITQAELEGARVLVDGRGLRVPGYPNGYFLGPTILDGITPEMSYYRTEVFGPVVGIMRVRDLDEAIDLIDRNPFGNAAVIFTRNGGAAREFRYRISAGNIGINVGVPAPMAYFPFGGMKASFLGTQHGQGLDAVSFFTDRKVVVTRWFGGAAGEWKARGTIGE